MTVRLWILLTFSLTLSTLTFLVNFINQPYPHDHRVLSKSRNILSNDETEAYEGSSNSALPAGLFKFDFSLSGTLFNDTGPSESVTSPISVSVVHSFSPWIEERVKRMYFDAANENQYRAIAPTIAVDPLRPRVIAAQRIWLSQYERDAARDKVSKVVNTWQENKVFEHHLSLHNYSRLDNGQYIGIPTSINCAYDYRADGIMDPRWITIDNKLYLTYHVWMVDIIEKTIKGRMFIWDYESQEVFKLQLDFENETGLALQKTEINWIPLAAGKTLYFIYSMDPLRVMRCSLQGNCTFVHLPQNQDKIPFNLAADKLRGGSQWIQYENSYYISATHAQFIVTNNFSYYSFHLTLLSIEPFRVVWVSRPIQVHHKLLWNAKIVRGHTIKHPFLYPVGGILWNRDQIDIGVHHSDSRGFIIRVSGIQRLFDLAISIDKKAISDRSVKFGPPNRSVQKSVQKFGEEHFNLKFKES